MTGKLGNLCARLILGVCAAFAISTPDAAFAQLDTGKPPPPVQSIDRNSVDLKSGEFVGTSPPIGVGIAEAPSLSYAAIDINYNTDLGTPLTGWVMYYACSNTIQSDCYRNYFTARIGNKTLTFYDDGSSEIHAYTGEVLSLADGAIYDNDDTKWDMGAGRGGSGPDNATYQVGSLQRITYRDGRTISFGHSTNGDRTAFSNDGYAIALSATRSEVRLINTAIDYCGLEYNNCERSYPWPAFLKSGAPGGTWNNTTTYHDDPLLRRTTVQSVVAPGGASQTHTITRPGGLTQTIGKASRSIFSDGGTSHSIFPVVSYSDQYGSASYTYVGDIQGSIVNTNASYSDGSSASRASPSAGTEARTDEIDRTTTYTFSVGDMQPWSHGPILGNLLDVRLPEQAHGGWAYDSFGNIIQSTAVPKPGSGLASAIARADYPNCPNRKTCHLPAYTLDAREARTDYTYDQTSGMMLTRTAPPDANGVRQETRYVHQQLQAVYKQAPGASPTPSGSPIWKLVSTSTCRTMAGAGCVGTADEVRTTISYNGNLLPISTTVQSGDGSEVQTTTRSYDPVGNVEWVDRPSAGTADRTYYFFDAARQAIGEIAADPDGPGPLPRPATRRTFNADGLVTSVQSGAATDITRAALDAMTVHTEATSTYGVGGRKLTDQVIGGGVQTLTQYAHDPVGRVVCTAVRMNPAAFGAQSDACLLGTEGTQGPDRITKNIYDAAGQLLQVRKAFRVEALEQAYVTYTYTANGKQEYITDANGNRARFIYDGFDRLFQWNFPDKITVGETSASDYEAYQYDANGNRIYLRKRDGTVFTYGHDALNRVTSKIAPNGTRSVHYSYDLRGLQTAARFDNAAGADAVINAYDAFGRLTSSATAMGGINRALAYQYDADGNRVRVTHPDGTFFTYDYDGLDRPIAARENGGPAVVTMAWDAQGRRSGEARGGVATTYGYDGISRISSLNDDLAGAAEDVVTTFTHNPASQIISRTRTNAAYAFHGYVNVNRGYTANGLNQYAAVAGTGFGYDPNGNLTSDGTSAYTYDAENRLVTTSAGASLSYDPLGRLHQISKPTTGTTQFLYDGDQLSAEYDGSGTLLRRYVHGTGEDDPLLWYEGTNLSDRRSLQIDHQGSIVSVAGAGGVMLALNAYDEYGIPAGGNMGRFQYTGQAWIPELGMYHYKARVYSPTLGRFLQTDPIGYDDQINLYAYVGNDPANRTDPTGEQEAPAADDVVVTGCRTCHTAAPLPPMPMPTMRLPPPPTIRLRSLPSWNNWTRDLGSSCFWIFVSCNEGAEPSDGAAPGPGTKGPSKQFEKPGGMKEANEDFDNAKPQNVSDKGNGIRVGTLPDGRTIIVRPISKEGRPTVEVRRPNGRGYEVRYGQ